MPRKRNYRKKRTIRRKRIYRKRRGTPTIRNVGNSPLAQRFLTKMKYGERLSITTGVGDQPTDYIFNMNSIFDPNRTGTGHQPFGHDTMAQLYNRYRVYKMDYKVICEPNSLGGNVTVIPNNNVNSLTGSDSGYIMELPRAKTRLINLDGPTTISGTCNIAAINGSTSAAYKADDRFQALFANSPTELLGLHIVVTNQVAGQSTFEVILNYHVELFDPLTIGIS